MAGWRKRYILVQTAEQDGDKKNVPYLFMNGLDRTAVRHANPKRKKPKGGASWEGGLRHWQQNGSGCNGG